MDRSHRITDQLLLVVGRELLPKKFPRHVHGEFSGPLGDLGERVVGRQADLPLGSGLFIVGSLAGLGHDGLLRYLGISPGFLEQASAKREIGLATDDALSKIAERAGELAVDVAGKFLRQKLSADDQQQLIRDSVASIHSAPSVN